MTLYVVSYDILPGKAQAYAELLKTATPRILAAPGILELLGYRPATGSHQIVATYAFPNAEAWAIWRTSEDIQKHFDESRSFLTNIRTEVWAPSPVTPQPLRPGA